MTALIFRVASAKARMVKKEEEELEVAVMRPYLRRYQQAISFSMH